VQLNQQILGEAVGHESMLDDQGTASLSLARIAYERNDLEAADQHARRALDLARQRANQTLEVQATIQLALLYSAKGDFSQARDLLKSLEAKIQNSMQLREIQNMQSSLSIRVHDLSNLEWWAKMITTETEGLLDLQREREAFTLARLRIAENRTVDAIDLLAKWKDLASDNGRLRSQIEVLCLEALALSAAAKDKEAAKVLSEALAIGYPKEFRRIFLDEGPRMAGLLQTTLSLLPSRSLRLFVSTLLQSFGSDASSSTPELSIQLEALSAQEVRVLRLLVAGLSNTDIARELIVSTNTIKTHLKNIYRKLRVNSREEAREVARELKLV
jgi:LuxR family maltose regulon positive regulatory protein